MQFLANENFPGAAVLALRDLGHDVAWVRLDAPGSTDREVLGRAECEGRILLTFDKDFGELAWRAKLPARCGIVLFRMTMPPPEVAGVYLARLLSNRSDWVGQFSVVEPGRIRMRPLPG